MPTHLRNGSPFEAAPGVFFVIASSEHTLSEIQHAADSISPCWNNPSLTGCVNTIMTNHAQLLLSGALIWGSVSVLVVLLRDYFPRLGFKAQYKQREAEFAALQRAVQELRVGQEQIIEFLAQAKKSYIRPAPKTAHGHMAAARRGASPGKML